MGLRKEFQMMRQAGGAPKITAEADATASADAKAKAATETKVENPDAPENELPNPFKHGQALNEIAPLTDSEPPVIPAPKVETKAKVKINGKEFASIEEATEYAAKIEIELEKQEAFRKGQESNKPVETAKPAEKKKILKIAEKLFEDPDATFEALEAHFSEMADRRAEERDNKKTAAQQAVDTAKQTWDNFYKNNADLSDWQDEVNVVLNREWKRLENVKADVALAEVAELSRKYISSLKEKSLPKQVLPSKTVVSPQGGQQSTTATSESTTKKKLSFADQVRSTNKRTAAQQEA